MVNIKRAVGSCSLKHVNCRDSQRLWCSGQCEISMKVGTHYPSQRISSKLLVSCGFGSCCKCVNTRAVIVVVSCCVYLMYATSCLFTARCTSLSHIIGVSGCLQPAEHTHVSHQHQVIMSVYFMFRFVYFMFRFVYFMYRFVYATSTLCQITFHCVRNLLNVRSYSTA